MKTVYVQPGKTAVIMDIGESLEDLQKAVGGYIEVLYPFEEEVGLIANEEGKIMGLPRCRAVRDQDGDVYDIIQGSFLVVGLGEEDFQSLTDQQAEKYCQLYKRPEAFLNGKDYTAVITL